MITKITILLLLCMNQFVANGQTIPDSYLQTLSGDSIKLSQYQGKKVMIIVLPVSHTAEDSIILVNVETTYQRYKDSVVFIGVPSYEDGYADSLSTDIKAWYRDTLHLTFAITKGMYTHNSSGSEQAFLFRWLTTENMNGHFGADITTHGQKFVLNEHGELHGVYSETTLLSTKLMGIIVGMDN